MVDFNSQQPFTTAEKAFDAGTPIDLQRLFGVFWRVRYWLVGLVICSFVSGVYIAKTFVPVTFSATSALVWEPRDKGLDPAEHERRLRTIVETVKIPKNLALTRERQGSAMSLEQLARRLSVTVRPDSSLIHITGQGVSAQEAKSFADEVVHVLIESDTAGYIAELEEEETRLVGLLEIARSEAVKSRALYDEFRGENGIIYLPSDRDQQVEQVRSLGQAAWLARVEARAQGMRAETLTKAKGKLSPSVLLSEHELDAAKQRQADLQAELESLRASLSPDHPRILTLMAQVQQLSESGSSLKPVVDARILGRHPQLDTIEASATTASADRDAAEMRHDTLADLQGQANARLEELNKIEGRAKELYATVSRTEERVVHFEERIALIRDELAAPAMALVVLSEANLPLYPTSSKRRMVAMAVPVVTVVLVCSFILALSNRGLRAHTAREIAYWSRLPVIAYSQWPDAKSEHDTPEYMLMRSVVVGGTTILVPMDASLGPVTQELGHLASADSTRDAQQSRPETFLEVERTSDLALLRKRVRLADRVVIVVRAGGHSVFELRNLCTRLGRNQGMAICVTGVGSHLANFAQQAGDVETYFSAAS